MKLYDLMKEYGIHAKSAKKRLANKQIKVNDEVRGGEYQLGNVTDVYDQGFFLEELYKRPEYKKFSDQIIFLGLSNIFDSNISNELSNFLSIYKMIELSKNNAIFIKVEKGGEKDKLDITFHVESESTFHKEFKEPEESNKEETLDKLKSDLEKVEKQLSNDSFINNAPAFKVESARKRKENIKAKIDMLINNESVYTFDKYSKL